MKTRIISIVVVLGVIGLIAFTLMRNKKEIDAKNKPVDRSEIPVAVFVAEAKIMKISGNLQLPAVLEAKDQSTVAATASGKLEGFRIDLGSRVSKGQVIGSIDTRVQQVEVRSRELTVAKLKKDYERAKELLAGNAINENAVTEAKYAYESNQLQLAQLKQQIANANILAPISGIVTDKKTMSGEFINPGTPLATIADVSQLKTVVFVNEKEVYQLKLKQKTNITCDVFPGQTFSGEVSYISPLGDDNHNYKIEILVSGKTPLKAGTYVKVAFDMNQESSVLQISKRALGAGMKNPFIYVANGTKAEKRAIVIGRELGENIEVLSGLKAGEKVIIEGQINLVNGSNIQVNGTK